jgi:hypothetical protein
METRRKFTSKRWMATVRQFPVRHRCVAAAQHQPVIYTDRGQWHGITGDSSEFSYLPLWLAGNVPSLLFSLAAGDNSVNIEVWMSNRMIWLSHEHSSQLP